VDKYLLKKLFQDIEDKTNTLCTLLQHDQESFVWLDLKAESRINIEDPVERLCFILKLFTLHESQKPKTVLMCPGFVAASPAVWDAFLDMNHSRKEFQHHMVETRKNLLGIKDSTLDNQFGNPSHERPELVDKFLREIGLHHLHFKHVYRCAPTIDVAPIQLAWTWAHTQSIKRISLDQAIALVERKNKKGLLDKELQKLHTLSADTHLSIRQNLAPHLRINWTAQDGTRRMLKGTLPVIFPKGSSLPIIRPVKKETDEDLVHTEPKTFRKDRTIGQNAFIPSIRAFIPKEQEVAFYEKYPHFKDEI